MVCRQPISKLRFPSNEASCESRLQTRDGLLVRAWRPARLRRRPHIAGPPARKLLACPLARRRLWLPTAPYRLRNPVLAAVACPERIFRRIAERYLQLRFTFTHKLIFYPKSCASSAFAKSTLRRRGLPSDRRRLTRVEMHLCRSCERCKPVKIEVAK
jgi:hypothetical protein